MTRNSEHARTILFSRCFILKGGQSLRFVGCALVYDCAASWCSTFISQANFSIMKDSHSLQYIVIAKWNYEKLYDGRPCASYCFECFITAKMVFLLSRGFMPSLYRRPGLGTSGACVTTLTTVGSRGVPWCPTWRNTDSITVLERSDGLGDYLRLGIVWIIRSVCHYCGYDR